MSLSVAIVGLPNVGKSTLFNALLKRQVALAANYPFATIDPNVGVVPVPDERLAVLAEVVKTSVIKPAMVDFIDIAGLVKGASQGEGLGNQFLSHIRECAVVCHVLRAFEDEEVIREGAVSPGEDLATVRTELQLADLATLEKQKPPKGSVEKIDLERWRVIEALLRVVESGKGVSEGWEKGGELAGSMDLAKEVTKELSLLTAKKELFVVNVSEKQLSEGVDRLTKQMSVELHEPESKIVVMCNQIESELSSLADEDQKLYLADLGLEQSGLERLIQAAYQTLGLQSFLTAGEKEVRAWTIPIGSTAREAAGVIHTDFMKKFISARVASYEDFVKLGGWKGLKDAGKMRTEGRDYLMEDGDVVEFMVGG